MEYYFQDQLRWSFGFENPNKAAAFIATLLPLVWVLLAGAMRLRGPVLKWGVSVVTAVALFTGWWLLFKTYSRGGIVAAVAAFLYIGFYSRRGIKRSPWFALAGVLLVAGLFITTQAAQRSVEWVGGHEGSVENRVTLWKGGLGMLAENPAGVGRGKSGAAYMQWYQPIGMTAGYRTLVNSYLTFAVEQGILIFGITCLLAVGFWRMTAPRREIEYLFGSAAGAPQATREAGFARDLVVGARASLLGFAAAGLFSTTMEEGRLWLVPGLCAGILAVAHTRRCGWNRCAISIFQGALAALVVCVILFVTGAALGRGNPLRIDLRSQGKGISITPAQAGGGKTLWVMVDEEVLGSDYGKLLRGLALESGMKINVDAFPREIPAGDLVLLSGDQVNRGGTITSGRLILLAPAKMDPAAAAKILKTAGSVDLLLPDFDEDGRARFWSDIAGEMHQPDKIRTTTLSGVGIQTVWAWELVAGMVRKHIGRCEN